MEKEKLHRNNVIKLQNVYEVYDESELNFY